MKEHFSCYFICFYNAKQINSAKDYFNYDGYLKFVDNYLNNKCWFSDPKIMHCYFADMVAKLVVSKFPDNIKKDHS